MEPDRYRKCEYLHTISDIWQAFTPEASSAGR